MFEILYVHIVDGKRVADTLEVSAPTLYDASCKFWDYVSAKSIDAIKYIEFERRA